MGVSGVLEDLTYLGDPVEFRTGTLERRRTVWRIVLALGIGGALATAVGIFELTRPGELFGVTEYDDGVYFASALRLVAGHLPYRDFTFVQPPGISIVLAPFALIAHWSGTRVAFGITRLFTVVVAGANAVLCGLVVRHRGPVAALVASCTLALFAPAFWAVHTVMLEPYLVLFCLIAANLAFAAGRIASRPRLVAAGICMGVATSVKLWGLLLAFVLFLVLLPHVRRAFEFALAVVVGVMVICGPFVVLAPRAFIDEVFTAQLLRASTTPTSMTTRLFGLFGLDGLRFHAVAARSAPLGLVVALCVLVLVLGAVVAPGLRHRAAPLEWFVVLAAVATSLAVLLPEEYFAHYVYVPAAFNAAAIGLALGACTGAVQSGLHRLRGRMRTVLTSFSGLIAGGVALALVLAALNAETNFATSFEHAGDPGIAIAAHVPPGACAVSDIVADLILANRLSEKPDCPTVIDATGAWLATDPRHPVASSSSPDPTLVASWRRWFGAADYVVLSRLHPSRIPWTPALSAYLRDHFTLEAFPSIIIYARRPDTFGQGVARSR